MKLIKLLKKMDSNEYVSIVTEDAHMVSEGCVSHHWVEYDTIDKSRNYVLMKLYKSKVLNIKVKELDDGEVYGVEIVIEYKEGQY